jgi:predicted nucleotidyltransferase component of viral defense system
MKNRAASLRQRLLNLSRSTGEEFRRTLERFALERLLYRLGTSRHRERFILKGALLFAAMTQTYRPTRDLDLLGFGSDDAGELLELFREVIALEGHDGLVFDPTSLKAEAIREGAEYGGVRLQIRAYLDGARIPLQVDIGFGDAITPAPRELEYPTLLELPAPSIRAYPLETVVAEKLEALIRLGMINSRMKDFYDLWVLTRQVEFSAGLLREAVEHTFARRRTQLPATTPAALTSVFAADPGKQAIWRAFLRRIAAGEISLEAVIERLRQFLEPILLNTARGQWNPEAGAWG